MLRIVLFERNALQRIAKKALEYLAKTKLPMRVVQDTLWLEGWYISFEKRVITVNVYNNRLLSKTSININVFLESILKGEEVFIQDETNNDRYTDCVSHAIMKNIQI